MAVFSAASVLIRGCAAVWTLDGKPAAEPFKGHNGADEGVYVPSDRLKQPFRMIVPVGQVIWQHGSLPELSAQRVKQVLLDDWTWGKFGIRAKCGHEGSGLQKAFSKQ